ncbi:heavy metal translocating P-type ATPase [Candidatus Synechococcus calcipolaris G9]|uniref:Heavy metal translocating P-type ATPase n=1 Tax=Candidatus Synechococcus calcipolaris G9 TaxID=1497997 RepID=A0ABT6ETU2_9SYNE|nr:heavy metal translocating P-type ATPase [Candidatus Synechococcus calcipolaris]MDG2989338.1 heavy metal translocating P-type ATPase [Candidatus Synechococcus calcipolaris G9]
MATPNSISPTTALGSTSADAITCEVVHTLPGRVRLRIPQLRHNETYLRQLQYLLVGEDPIQQIRINVAASSVVVEYEPDTNHLDLILAIAQRANDPDLPPPRCLPVDKQVYSPWNTDYFLSRMAIPVAVLGIIALLPPTIPFYPVVITGLVLWAALPTFREALESIEHKEPLNVTHLESLWTILHALQGEFMAPALASTMNTWGGSMRDMTAQVGEKQVFDPFDLTRTYWIERQGQKQQVTIRDMQPGDYVIVSTGAAIPVDGRIVWGTALINQQFLTGEGELLPCEPDGEVFASTVVAKGQICIRAERVGNQTKVAQVLFLAKQAPHLDTRIENYAEEISNKAILPAMGVSAVVFALTRDAHRSIAPLQLDFGSGIGITVPTAILAALSHAPQLGVYIRNGRALELLSRLDAIVFDKTGTLTEVRGTISGLQILQEDLTEETLLYWLATVEQHVNHPFGIAILDYAQEKGVSPGDYTDWDYEPGRGVIAKIADQEIRVGTLEFIQAAGIEANIDDLRSHEGVLWNRSLVYVSCNQELVAIVSYSNPLRPEAAALISALKKQRIDCYMVTGDHHEVANAVAYSAGFRLGNIYTNVLPEEKAEIIQQLRDKGKQVVAFVGEGLNDSAALAHADISISLSEGSDVARQTADILLMQNDLQGILQAIALSKEVMQIINQNIALVVIPNVSVVLAGIFLSMHPVVAVLISNGATLLAELNGLRIFAHQKSVKGVKKTSGRSQEGLLTVPWKKRPRRSFAQLQEKLN